LKRPQPLSGLANARRDRSINLSEPSSDIEEVTAIATAA
jgi:hypothetical protein